MQVSNCSVGIATGYGLDGNDEVEGISNKEFYLLGYDAV
jgi:hypothetical protein